VARRDAMWFLPLSLNRFARFDLVELASVGVVTNKPGCGQRGTCAWSATKG
jgi:hypothetical protein